MFTSFSTDSHQKHTLHNGWLLELPAGIPQLGGAAGTAIPAEVPGCVHLDLLRAGLIDDPFAGDNEPHLRWIDETAWTYRSSFEVTEEFLAAGSDRRQLVFEGLDTFADVYLDGELLGSAENMFHPHRFELPNSFAAGKHELEVRFDSPLGRVDRLVEERGPAPDSFGWHRGWARKAGYSYGWDWGPEFPGAGIFRTVYLQVWDEARIDWFRSDFSGDAESGKLGIHLTLTLEGDEPLTVQAVLDHAVRQISCSEEIAGSGEREISLTLEIDNPSLWWPNGHGDPVLHNLDLILCHGDREVHRISERVGLRTVEWVQQQDQWGESFFIRVNGVDIFAKGANWIPADSFLPRVTPEIYHRQLDLAVQSNMNMLRIWGGGLYEDPVFYRAADEKGIMLWQDFMYACSLYPDHPAFRENAVNEARWVVASLVRHPSIVLWCGNNEIERDAEEFQERFGTPYLGKSLWFEQLPKVMEEMALEAFYIPSSPIGGPTPNSGVAGDRHVWSVWSGWREGKDYREEPGRFISEFGWQAPANVATWREALEEKDLDPTTPTFQLHNKQVDGPDRIAHFLSLCHHPCTSFEEFVHGSQDVQARALVVALEFWRSSRPKTMGTLIWQLNDCWPVTSWALFDSKMRPKASWYRVRRAYASRTLVLMPEKQKVSLKLLNDEPEPWACDVNLTLYDFFEGAVRRDSVSVQVEPGSVLTARELSGDLWLSGSPTEVLVAETVDGRLAEGRAWLLAKPFKEMELPKTSLTVEKQGADRVLVHSSQFAFGVWVEDADNPDLMFSDNAFDLLPGETVELTAVDCRTGEPAKISKPRVRWID